ncbi:hypothetical protein [Kribbella sp. NPDC049227]|uniref:hypothetical protein n=1 Tax=Kribbella sp. NPDC049227 TaxID=3364113 RepID=UPI00371D8DD0
MTGHTLRLLRAGIWRSSVEWWSFRSFVITLVAGQTVTPLLGLFVWSSAVPGSSGITTYYVVLLAVQLVTVSFEHHTLANAIYGGDFAAELVKPRPVVLDFLATNLALRFWHLLFGLPVIVIVGLFAGVSLRGLDLVWRCLPSYWPRPCASSSPTRWRCRPCGCSARTVRSGWGRR